MQKHIIVTGASSGIGFELVKRFAQLNNCNVYAIARNKKALGALIDFEDLGDESSVTVLPYDLTSEIPTIISSIKKLTKQIDILVNNAGSIVNKPFEKIKKAELEQVYAVNVFAPFQLCQALLPLMGKKTKAHIVNISSMGGFQGSAKFAGLSAYSSSKAAIAGLTECLAEEFKDKNISVNCLAIGAVQTPMLNRAFPGYEAPLKPSQMADFMASFALEGNKYMNGKILPVSLSTP